MKKLVLLILVFIVANVNAQKLVMTPNGLRDANDLEKTFVVINAEGKTANELYHTALKYINQSYKSPDDVIKGKTEAEYLSFSTHASGIVILKAGMGLRIYVSATYLIVLNFKDGKVKFEITNIDAHAIIGGEKTITGLEIIYVKQWQAKNPNAQTDIENHFNSQILALSDFLVGKKTNDNW